MNFHGYSITANPEVFFSSGSGDGSISTFRAALQTQEQSKPLWMGEGSYSDSLKSSNWWQDSYAQGGYPAKYFAALWSNTMPNGCTWNAQVCQQAFWYGYDHDVTTANSGWNTGSYGALYCPGESQQGSCNGGNAELLEPQAGMWNVAVDWLTGAVPPSTGSFCNPLPPPNQTTWHCDFTKGSTNYSMVWDNSNAGVHSDGYCVNNFSNPYICGNTNYTVPTSPVNFVGGSWVDMNPTITYQTASTVTIGLNPILLVAP
jgi:hypothetical protein